jgi:hypothetical protein
LLLFFVYLLKTRSWPKQLSLLTHWPYITEIQAK